MISSGKSSIPLFLVLLRVEKLGESSLALGCDIDGTDGLYPQGFGEGNSIHDRLFELLLSHYGASVVERIMSENAADFLKGAL